MNTRCNNPNNHKFPDYGGRGITICDRWKSFQTFFDDMGERASLDHTLERKDVNGNYEPGNCIWASNLVQANNRRSNVYVEVGGERLTIAEACRKYNVPYHKTWRKLRKEMSIEKAFNIE